MTTQTAQATEDDRPNPQIVAAQNDMFRQQICLRKRGAVKINGRLVMTRSLHALGPDLILAAVKAVGAFDAFTPDNDPDEYHDFGAVTVGDHKIWFKIDLFQADGNLQYGAEHPDDPDQTERVLTIMLPSDW